MIFELNETQQLVQDTARRFALEEIAPTLEDVFIASVREQEAQS